MYNVIYNKNIISGVFPPKRLETLKGQGLNYGVPAFLLNSGIRCFGLKEKQKN